MGGWGVIGRDHAGDIVFTAAGRNNSASDALYSETIALQNGIRIADQLGIGHVIISTDSQLVKHAIESPSLDQARLDQLFLDIKYHLVMEFNDYSVEFCPRACNKPAHVLAAMGLDMDQNNHFVWLSKFPTDVISLTI